MPGAGGMGQEGGGGFGFMNADYMSPQMANSMRLFAIGDILRGGNGGSYFNYMNQAYQYEQAQAQAQQEAAAAAAAEEEQRRMQAEAQSQMADMIRGSVPNPVQPFDRMSGASIGADTMATLFPNRFPGIAQGVINSAAQTNNPLASSLVSTFYNMPQDVAASTRAEMNPAGALFQYNNQDAREWARENVPNYGMGFQGPSGQATYGAQSSMPTPMAPERLAQIMMNPAIPAEMKKQVWEQFGGGGAEPKYQYVDGVGIVDMNNPPPNMMAGQFQDPTSETTDQKNYAAYVESARQRGIAPMPFEEFIGIKTPQTNVTVGGEGEVSADYWKERDKQLANTMAEMETAAATARGALTSLDVMGQLMDQPGFYSGAGGEALLQAKRVARALGLDPAGVDSMDAFNAQAKAAALDAMGGSLGTGFSNADRDFVTDQVPGLDKSDSGNRMLLEIQKKIQQRKIDIANMAMEYERENKGLRGFSQVLAEWAAANPVFDPGFVQSVSAAQSPAQVTAETGAPQENPEATGAEVGDQTGRDVAGPPPADWPKVGTVEDGFEYLGGDPSNPDNWRKVE